MLREPTVVVRHPGSDNCASWPLSARRILDYAPEHVPDDIRPEVQANRSEEAILPERLGGEHPEQAVEQYDLHESPFSGTCRA